MQRRLVELRDLAALQIEHFERQLAAGDHHRPPAGDPSPSISSRRMSMSCAQVTLGGFDRPMDAGIEDANDLAFDLDAIGNVDDVGEEPADLLGDRALAIAGRAVKQDGAARIDCRTEAVHELVADHQAGEGEGDSFAIDPLVADALAQDLIGVGAKRHRRRADIAVLLERFDGPDATAVRQGIVHDWNAFGGVRAQDLQQLPIDRRLQDVADHRARQLQHADQPGRGVHRRDMHGLDQQAKQGSGADAGRVDRGRRCRRRHQQHGMELLERDQAKRQQAVGQAAAALATARRGEFSRSAGCSSPLATMSSSTCMARPPADAVVHRGRTPGQEADWSTGWRARGRGHGPAGPPWTRRRTNAALPMAKP